MAPGRISVWLTKLAPTPRRGRRTEPGRFNPGEAPSGEPALKGRKIRKI
jgi:hypothetical protein